MVSKRYTASGNINNRVNFSAIIVKKFNSFICVVDTKSDVLALVD